jgi:putative adhesin
MKRIHIVTFIVILISSWTALVWSQDANGDRVTVAWSDPSRPGLLKVNLMQGGITVRTHSGNDVIIESRARGRGNNRRPEPPEAGGLRRIDGGGGGLVVEESNNVMSVGSQSYSRSVDLDIQVPAKTSLNLKTMNGGNIVIEGVEGEMEVTNMNGGVTLNNVAGSVIAHSMNGRVVASLKQAMANKPMAFTSMNGNIDVTLPQSLKANMKMRTDNGEIYSDFDIQLRPTNGSTTTRDDRGRGGRFRIEIDKSISGAVNGGGPDFDLRTLNGNIYIRKGAQ